MVTLEINGRMVKAEEGATVLDAARSVGAKIATLCHHPELSPYGSCRLCTVEVLDQGRKSRQASCCFPVKDGLQVQTDAPALAEGRKLLLELFLARCPKSTAVIKLCREWGVTESSFSPKQENCVLCGLCVRACADLTGAEAIAFSGRGVTRKVTTPFNFAADTCLACGACSYVCPTGQIQMEAETAARLRKRPGVDRQCRYMLMGLVSMKLCPNNYDCATCAFDQSMETRFGTHPAFVVAAAREAAAAKQKTPGG